MNIGKTDKNNNKKAVQQSPKVNGLASPVNVDTDVDENVEVDDGDLDLETTTEPFLYQNECDNCAICDHRCTKNKMRNYLKLPINKLYPDI